MLLWPGNISVRKIGQHDLEVSQYHLFEVLLRKRPHYHGEIHDIVRQILYKIFDYVAPDTITTTCLTAITTHDNQPDNRCTKNGID